MRTCETTAVHARHVSPTQNIDPHSVVPTHAPPPLDAPTADEDAEPLDDALVEPAAPAADEIAVDADELDTASADEVDEPVAVDVVDDPPVDVDTLADEVTTDEALAALLLLDVESAVPASGMTAPGAHRPSSQWSVRRQSTSELHTV